MLESTAVVSLEQLREDLSSDAMESLRFDDIPRQYIANFERPEASDEYTEYVRDALRRAREAADAAMDKKWSTAPKSEDGRHILDSAGIAGILLHDAQSPLVSALLFLGEASPTGGIGYRISDIGLRNRVDQALCLSEAAVEAGLEVLEECFPNHVFSTYTRLD